MERLYMTRDRTGGVLRDTVDVWTTYPVKARHDSGDVIWLGRVNDPLCRIILTLQKAMTTIGVIPDDEIQVISFPSLQLKSD